MPSAALVHAAIFTAGAVIGGGIAAAVTNKNKATAAPVSVPVPAALPSRTPALVGMQAGKPHVSSELVAAVSDLPVMKFGHPGLEIFLSRKLGSVLMSATRTRLGHSRAQGICGCV